MGQAIEDVYQKKTQLEHILLRPDTYIGSTEKQQQKMWVHDGMGIKLADIDYVPGLYKIFDEILVNAADNKVRDPKMDTLKVDINKVSCTARVPRLEPSCCHLDHHNLNPLSIITNLQAVALSRPCSTSR